MKFENKIAIVVRKDLKEWQKLNVTAFLSSSVAIKYPETHGAAFITASNAEYLPFLNQPVMIYGAEGADQIKRAFNRAKDRDLSIGIYTAPLFATRGEAENLAEIAKFADEDQDLVGIILYGENRKVNKALDGLKFHP